MALLQRRQRTQERSDTSGGGLAKRDPDRGTLARVPDYRRQIDRAFDRLFRQFERDPFSALSALPAQLGGLVDWPAIDVAEDEKAMTIRVDVPGVEPSNINVEVSGNLLTISGRREDEWTENQRGVRRRERISGSFARTITLPSYVDPQNIEARYENGTLTLTIPKAPGKGPKHVQVRTS